MTTISGRCFCKAIAFEISAAPSEVIHCHCESCRRATSAPVATFLIVKRDDFRYVQGRPVTYDSSPGVRRSFCGACGSPLAYETEQRPDDIDLYVCSLDDPSAVTPQSHVHEAERLPWFEIQDDLPRYATTPPRPPINPATG